MHMMGAVAGTRQTPDPLEGLTKEQLRELATRASELAEANEDVADADTPAEEREAAEAAAEAERALAASAQRAGLSPEETAALLDAFEERTATVTERVMRKVLDEVTVVEEDAGDPPPPGDPPPVGDPPADPPPAAAPDSLEQLQAAPDAPPPPAPAVEDTPPETPPERTHFMDRPLFKREDAAS